jgi:hypothetical protein
MTTITLPPEVVGPLAEEARRRGTTPELLAIDYLRERFVASSPDVEAGADATLYDFLSGYIGAINGSTEALSEETARRFVEGLIELKSTDKDACDVD